MARAASSIDDGERLPRPHRDHDAMLESFLRHWNRIPKAVRIDAAELIATSDGDEIEP